MKIKNLTLALLLCWAGWSNTSAQQASRTGTISGTVIDRGTHESLPGAHVQLADYQMGTVTDKEGNFRLDDVPVGGCIVKVSYIGYQSRVVTDVMVHSNRITQLEIELSPTTIEGEELTVTAGYFNDIEEQPVSASNFSTEEVRRAPGAAGDLSRIVTVLPSVVQVNDQQNGLVVRGGSPIENSFYIDHIEVPNINHFPSQGSSGGAIGMINPDLVSGVDFYSGGFDGTWGNSLSSVMDIQLRQGNTERFEGQLELSFEKAGATLEGPLTANRGSWMATFRRSYIDQLLNMMNQPVTPRYHDGQFKAQYPINKNHKLSVVDVFGSDYNDISREDGKDLEHAVYGLDKHFENTAGLNWLWLRGEHGFSRTTISHSVQDFYTHFNEYESGDLLTDKNATEHTFRLRNVNNWKLGNDWRLELGLEAEQQLDLYDIYYPGYTDATGRPTPETRIDNTYSNTNFGSFINLKSRLLPRLDGTISLRYDYFGYNDSHYLAPRGNLTWQISPRWTLNAAAGRYVQELPMVLATQDPANKMLAAPEATHYVLGLNHLITPSTRLSVEAYYKRYDHFPMDPDQPKLFTLDELIYGEGFLYSYGALNNRGEAFSKGVELSLQKKLTNRLYGFLSGSLFEARYRDLNGHWVDRVTDNNVLLNVMAGYRMNRHWEFSMKWTYAGGRPYTPIDVEASRRLDRTVLDDKAVNAQRYPAYHSMNVRADRRFFYRQTNLIVFISVWNAYNRSNVVRHYWDQVENQVNTEYQWTLLPIFGVEFEF